MSISYLELTIYSLQPQSIFGRLVRIDFLLGNRYIYTTPRPMFEMEGVESRALISIPSFLVGGYYWLFQASFFVAHLRILFQRFIYKYQRSHVTAQANQKKIFATRNAWKPNTVRAILTTVIGRWCLYRESIYSVILHFSEYLSMQRDKGRVKIAKIFGVWRYITAGGISLSTISISYATTPTYAQAA